MRRQQHLTATTEGSLGWERLGSTAEGRELLRVLLGERPHLVGPESGGDTHPTERTQQKDVTLTQRTE